MSKNEFANRAFNVAPVGILVEGGADVAAAKGATQR